MQTSFAPIKKQFNLCIAPDSLRDVDLSVRLRAISGRSIKVAVSFGDIKMRRTITSLRWNPLEQNLRVYKVVRGMRTQLDSAEALGETNAWHTLRVVNHGRSIRGYFNGQLLLDAEDDEFATAGRIGLWSKADAVTEFDDLSITTAFDEP